MVHQLKRRLPPPESGDEGYMLLAILVLVFLVTLALTAAAPKVAEQLKRERELETKHRAEEYVRAIRVFYRKNGHYPTSVEQLEKTNNQRFLRQRYLDPMTGKDDWRLIAVGQNKTTVKGFFGQDLPGIGGPIGGSGIGSGATTGGSGLGGSSFGTPGIGAGGGAFGSGNGPQGNSPSSFGSGSGSSFGSGNGSGNGSGSGSGNGASGSNGSNTGSQNATDFKGATGPFMGVGVPKSGEAFLTVNGVSTYEEWEFLYDPRIEQLYAKGATMGGGISSGSGTSGNGLGNGQGPGIGNGAGVFGGGGSGPGSGGGFGGGSGGFGGGTPTPPNTPP